MKTRRSLLFAMTAASGLSVAFAGGAAPLSASSFRAADDGRLGGRPMRAGYHDGGDSNHHSERFARRNGDDRHGSGEHRADGEEDGDDGDHQGSGNSPARAGTTTAPDNGLILKGTTPKAQIN